MANSQIPDADFRGPGTSTQTPINATGAATIDAPEVNNDGQLDLESKSVKTVKHANDICTAAEVQNRARSLRTADIQSAYDGAPPRSQTEKVQKLQAWQSNFSTRWLAGIVDPAVLRLKKAITQQISLTKSQLAPNYPAYKEKSDIFQGRITKAIRSWKGFQDLTDKLGVENGLHGYAFAVFQDSINWRPTFFRQENAYIPEESGHNPEDLQWFVAKHDFLLHEFVDMFRDESAAETAGYDIENCIYAANTAQVRNPRDDILTTQFRKFADMINQGTLGLTYTNTGPRIVKVYMLWNREYDGKVSFWLINRDNGNLLRFVSKIYDNMTQVVSMFSLESGNGKFHSSKGLGRRLFGMSMAVEEGRNNALDSSRMGAMLLLKVPAKDRNKLQPVIHAPFIVFPSEIEIQQQKFAVNADEFLKLDSNMSGWAQQSSGAYIASVMDPSGNSNKTATEATIDANRERESTDLVRARWIDQFAYMVGEMQRRICSDSNIQSAEAIFQKILDGAAPEELYASDLIDDKDAVKIIVELLTEDITVDEIKQLRDTPASGLAHMEDVANAAGITKIAQMYTGNPNLDQIELLRRNVEAIAGPDAAKQLVVKDIDQTIQSEAARQQLLEASTMIQLGVEVPISPRDNHIVHALTLKPLIASTFPTISTNPNPDPKLMKGLQNGLNHMAAHLEAAAQGDDKTNPVLKELETWLKQTIADVQQAVQVQAQVKEHARLTATAIGYEKAGGVIPDNVKQNLAGGSGQAQTPQPPEQQLPQQ